MAKSFDQSDRDVAKAPFRLPEQRSKATGGGKSPLDPMGAAIVGYSSLPGQATGDSPNPNSDVPVLAGSSSGDKKSSGLPGR